SVLVHNFFRHCRRLGRSRKFYRARRKSVRGAQAASLQSSAACRRLSHAEAFRQAAEKAGRLSALPRGESKRLGRFQQLDDALEQTSGAATVEAAVIEAQGNLRCGDGNEFGFR